MMKSYNRNLYIIHRALTQLLADYFTKTGNIPDEVLAMNTPFGAVEIKFMQKANKA